MKRTQLKSGCGCGGGKIRYVLELDVPVSRNALKAFTDAGYKVSEVYTRVGVFHVEKGGVTCSGPFGGHKMQVRCGNSPNCSQAMDNLENTFRMIAAQEQQ